MKILAVTVKSMSMKFMVIIQISCFYSNLEKVWMFSLNYFLVSDSIEAAAENDLYNKELAYDKLRFDGEGEEIIYTPETNGGY